MWRPKLLILVLLCLLAGPPPVNADTDLNGQWYGAGWDAVNVFTTTNIDLYMTEAGGSGQAVVYVPDFGLFHQTLPLTVDGDSLVIGDPSAFGITGTIVGETIEGHVYQLSTVAGTWYVEKEYSQAPHPGPAPGPPCDDLPPMNCDDGGLYACDELIQFVPSEGWGYLDYPLGGETWNDQRYSYLRRDLVYLVKYAAAKVACKTSDWDYGNFAPLGLGDMSQADGATPGTDVGQLRHPPGTHAGGLDIDTGYYQIYTPDNLLRAIGDQYEGNENQWHLVSEPYLLDVWRTALFIAYLSEHPRLRVIGVDAQAGLILDEALDELVTLDWIDAGLRNSINLAYEFEDGGQGWFLFHHHHMHISWLYDVTGTPDTDALPVARLHDCYPNPFNPRTTVGFELAQSSAVQLTVYDVTGRLVQQLVDGEAYPAGLHKLDWGGRDLRGRPVASGVYYYRLEVDGKVQTKKMVLMR